MSDTVFCFPLNSIFIDHYFYNSRPKNALTKEKIKLFLKNSLYRVSDKHPLIVKVKNCYNNYLPENSIGFDVQLG